MKTSRQNYRLLAQHGLLARIVACGIAAIGLSATFVFSAATQASTPTPRPIVQISDGRIQGVRRGSVDEFLGIPFAAPPVGPLRWQPPRRPKPWATVLQTTRFAPVCAQVTTLGVYAGPQSDDEDCLYLNVFAPRRHPLRPMPVIAYIHGGGNFSGAARDYDASELARSGNVVVTIAYRLNLLGFIAHPALDREGHPFANYGLLDQQAALRWVRRNAAAFGGDVSNVTLGGQSNGGYDALLQMVSPLARGLFHKAISQSGTRVIFDPIPTREAAEKNGIAFAVAAGCGSGLGPEVAKCLRDLPAARIEQLAGTALDRSKFVINTAIVDGTIIPEQPLSSFGSGRFSRVPLMIGATTDERRFFSMTAAFWGMKNEGAAPRSTAQDYRDFIATTFAPPSYTSDARDHIAKRYPLNGFGDPRSAIERLSSDATLCIARRFSALLSPMIPVFAYEFADRTAPSYFPPVSGMETGAYHSAELQYLFPLWHGGPDGVPVPLNAKQRFLARQITLSVANFARSTDPSPSAMVLWPRFGVTSNARSWMMQGTNGFAVVTDQQYARMHSCEFWDAVST